MSCKHCGGKIETGYNLPEGVCYQCNYWFDQASDRKNAVVCDGIHYRTADEDARGMRGFGGNRYKITSIDGSVAYTTNLWFQGKIPERFRSMFPDTATEVKAG